MNDPSDQSQRAKIVRELVARVTVAANSIVIRICRRALIAPEFHSRSPDGASDASIELTAAVAFRQRGIETRLILPGAAQQNDGSRPDPALVKAVARGRTWFEELATGRARSLGELAQRDGITRRYIRRLVNLAFLCPELVEAVQHGRHPVALTATRLTELDLPLDWNEQRQLLAI